jgi:hypothetical protein
MTAAAGRAEIYLRLMAEAELRRALAYPRYEPPRPPGLPPAAQSAVRLSRPLLAPLLPPLSTAARMSGSLLESLWPAARTAAWAARQMPAGRAAEPVLWRALRIRHAVQPLLPGRGRGAPLAEAALDRVRQVAGTLVSAGVISEAGAEEVLQSLIDALTLRGRLGPVYWLPGSGPWGPRFPWRPAGTTPPLPAAPVRAIPIGTALPLGPGGGQGTACLLALAMGPARRGCPGPVPARAGPDRGPRRRGRSRRSPPRTSTACGTTPIPAPARATAAGPSPSTCSRYRRPRPGGWISPAWPARTRSGSS